MQPSSPSLFIILMFLTLGVLVVGIFAMAKGGNFNKKYANKLMVMRVVLQFAAVVMIVLLYFFKKS
jgi:succinate dehydrogenase/fumarate reductase cytochrome b subunit